MKVRWNEVLNHLDSQRYPYPYLYPRHQTFMKSKILTYNILLSVIGYSVNFYKAVKTNKLAS